MSGVSSTYRMTRRRKWMGALLVLDFDAAGWATTDPGIGPMPGCQLRNHLPGVLSTEQTAISAQLTR